MHPITQTSIDFYDEYALVKFLRSVNFCKSKIKPAPEQGHGGSIVNCLPKSQVPECGSLIISEAMMHVLT